MRKKYFFIAVFVVLVSSISIQKNYQKCVNDTDLKWWAEAMASDSESGGYSHSLDCGSGLGACRATCDVHRVTLMGTGAGTAKLTCGS